MYRCWSWAGIGGKTTTWFPEVITWDKDEFASNFHPSEVIYDKRQREFVITILDTNELILFDCSCWRRFVTTGGGSGVFRGDSKRTWKWHLFTGKNCSSLSEKQRQLHSSHWSLDFPGMTFIRLRHVTFTTPIVCLMILMLRVWS